MRAMIRFGKEQRVRFISHLDLQRFFQRALNRTGLPIAYTQGFNPHPVMSFASALALGWTSEYEILDFKLAVPMGRVRTEEAMRKALPGTFPIYETRMVEDRFPAPMRLVTASDYRVIPDPADLDAILEAAQIFMKSEQVRAVRKTKSGEREVDIRPFVLDMRFEEGALLVRLMLTEKESLRPDLLMRSLYAISGLEERRAFIHRLTLLGKGNGEELFPLMELT